MITANVQYQLQEVIDMDKFVIAKDENKMSSINRTVRFKPDHFEKLTELSAETGISFNKILTQCIEFALSRLDEDE